MRSGLWPRRLSRWRTRKSLPTDGAAFRAASATARDVSLGLRPGGRVAAALRGGAWWRRASPSGRRPPPRRADPAPRCPRRGPPLCSPGDQNSARMDAKSGHRGCKVSGSGWCGERERQLADRRRDLPRTLCTRRHFVHQVTRKQARSAQKVVISCAKSTEVTAVTGGRRLVRRETRTRSAGATGVTSGAEAQVPDRVTELALGRPAWPIPARGGAGRIRLCGLARCR
jgi:hypothetical protein